MAEDIPSYQGATEEATEEEPSKSSLDENDGRQQRLSRVKRRQRLESKGESLLPSFRAFAYQIFNLALLYL